jgi:hypothetical protein
MMAVRVYLEINPNYSGLAQFQGRLIASAEGLGIIAALAFMFDSQRSRDEDT